MKKKVKELEKNGVFHSQWSALMSQTRSKIGLAIVLLFRRGRLCAADCPQ